MYIWAFDPSINSTGVAIFSDDATPILKFSIQTNSKGSHGKKLREIYDAISPYMKTYPCEIVVFESGFTRFNKATQVLYRVHGLIEFMFSDAQRFSYAPTSIKKTITGNGRATKEEVRDVLLGEFPHMKFENDDESDAFAACICYFTKEGIIDSLVKVEV